MKIHETLGLSAVFIKYILSQEVHSFKQNEDVYFKYIEPNQFIPTQLFNSPALFRSFIEQLEEKKIYELTDHLKMSWFFICTQNWVTQIGPCNIIEMNAHSAQIILENSGIRDTQLSMFNLYRNTFPHLSEDALVDAAYAIIKGIYGDTEDAPVVRIVFDDKTNLDVFDQKADHLPQQISTIEYTHDLESRFMAAISQGNTAEATLLIRQLMRRTVKPAQSTNGVAEQKMGISGIAIARTIARIAARNAGVPSPAIDALSGEFARRSYDMTTNVKEVNAMLLELAERFCELVRQYRLRPYSPLIRKAIHYVLLNLSNELSVEQIAVAVNVSPNYLSAVFHKEVGKTLLSYILDLRLEKSERLLNFSAMSIQEISASVGIPDNNYFTKLFKKKYGKTPSAFRRQLSMVKNK